MTRNELKNIIKECLLEENSQEDIVEESIENISEDTILEFSTDEYRENKVIFKEIDKWCSRIRKLSMYYYFIKKPKLDEAMQLKDEHDKNKTRWTSNDSVKAWYNKNMVQALYNDLKTMISKMKDASTNTTSSKSTNIISEDEAKKIYNELLSALKKLLPKLKSSSEYKKQCKESSMKMNDSDYKSGYEPKLVVNEFESLCKHQYGYDAIIEIIDDEQIVRIYYSWILYDLIDLLEKEYNDLSKKVSIDYGDGDEGCLYISIK